MVNSLFEDPPRTASTFVPDCPFELRPYQEKAIASILAAVDRGVKRALLVMPTGCGKTKTFAELIRRMSGDPDFAALILAHRFELLEQGARAVSEVNPHLIATIEAGDRHAAVGADVVLAGVQSIGRPDSRRLSWLDPKLIITDEAHHSAADSYVTVYRRYGCWEPDSSVFHLGVTATPHRLDNKPLHGSERTIYDEIVFQYTLREAISDKWLVDIRGFRVAGSADLSQVKTTAGDYNQKQLQDAMNTSAENELAFRSWRDKAEGRKTIVFCTGVEHARDVAAVFRAHGIPAESVTGEMKREDRDGAIRRFRSGETLVLTSMDVLTEGFDVPDASCVLMLRPTQSWSLFTQMIGRGLRLSKGKEDCVVIDVVGVTAEHSLSSQPRQGREPVSLAGLVGLPPKMDLEGNTVSEAIALFESLPERGQAVAFKRCTSFRGLNANLEQVDLLAELAIPEEISGVGQFAWMKLKDGEYFLSCGSGASEAGRQAVLTSDAIGNWKLELRSDKRKCENPLEGELKDVFRAAERIIAGEFEGVGAIVRATAKWRKDAPTESQLKWLRKFKVEEEVIGAMDKGMASAMLSKLFSEKGGKR